MSVVQLVKKERTFWADSVARAYMYERKHIMCLEHYLEAELQKECLWPAGGESD